MAASGGLTPQELDELYTALTHGLAELGDDRAPMALARLALLLMHEVGDPQRVAWAVEEALDLD
jgi:hypothetical protein